jgi:hypothetical protein
MPVSLLSCTTIILSGPCLVASARACVYGRGLELWLLRVASAHHHRRHHRHPHPHRHRHRVPLLASDPQLVYIN